MCVNFKSFLNIFDQNEVTAHIYSCIDGITDPLEKYLKRPNGVHLIVWHTPDICKAVIFDSLRYYKSIRYQLNQHLKDYNVTNFPLQNLMFAALLSIYIQFLIEELVEIQENRCIYCPLMYF
ncbi:Hypothetical_protein [Hexamita inflata]|uniref:Hypothetical_protein n=1 Tax=Hexamita inflata TaxID=28002 RepID=A0AA86R3K1_9EUKA|nr:Hypothetical protein HINF_LOCUS49180 [Hexamita inflata]